MKSKSAFAAISACLLCACGTDATPSDADAGTNSHSVDDDSSSHERGATSSTFAGSASHGSSSTQSRESSATNSALSQGSTTFDSNGETHSTDVNPTSASTSAQATSTHDVTGDNTSTNEPAATTGSTSEGDANSTSDSTTNAPTSASDGSTSGDVGTDDGCEFSGTISYRINSPESFPADALTKLTGALDEAIYYYNCYSDLSHSLTINYKPSVPTAEGNVDGVISFGSDRNYMVVATVMHEIGHTMGVGYAPWSEFIEDGKWIGPAVVQYMTNLPANERDPDDYSQRTFITCDTQHFWPYGLNQASEHQSEWSLINHVRIVAAMNQDKDTGR